MIKNNLFELMAKLIFGPNFIQEMGKINYINKNGQTVGLSIMEIYENLLVDWLNAGLHPAYLLFDFMIKLPFGIQER